MHARARRLLSFAVASLTLGGAAPVFADEVATLHRTAAAPAPYSVGVRVGGYGFRREREGERSAWDECRMNGVGLFAQRQLRGPLFAEAATDLYFSDGLLDRGTERDLPLDRMSALASVAIGVRSDLTARLRGYAQLGAGVELTRLSVPYGDTGEHITGNKVLPDGFLGVGGDLRPAAHTYLGATLRMHVMGNFAYDQAGLEQMSTWAANPSADDVFAASPDLATQGQFYVRRDL